MKESKVLKYFLLCQVKQKNTQSLKGLILKKSLPGITSYQTGYLPRVNKPIKS